jgi:hypothetical protein
MDNGLTQPEDSEIIMHIAFYAGWPNAFSALPVFKEVVENRPYGWIILADGTDSYVVTFLKRI